MAAKKFGLKCKIFMGAKDIKRQKPNVDSRKKNVQKLYLFMQESKH
jgi:tryptophan synthase beta subunit